MKGAFEKMSLAAIQPFLILPIIYLARGWDLSEGSSNLFYLRIAFGLVQVLSVGMMFLIKQRIEAKQSVNKTKTIVGKEEKIFRALLTPRHSLATLQ